MSSKTKILIIIQRSNGDVYLSSTLINKLYEFYESPLIDLLVNDDTYSIAKFLPNVNNIHQFSYKKKRENRFSQEKSIIFKIYKKYDLSINLTASDRSVLYASLSAKKSISAIEKDIKKSWWKKYVLTHYYYFDSDKHILLNNLKSLEILNIKHEFVHISPNIPRENKTRVDELLAQHQIKDFIIFHPSAQYNYKIYDENLRNKLLYELSRIGISVVITGSKNKIDTEIKKSLPNLLNIYDFIGKTSLGDYLALSKRCIAYVGMDTLNMHIAASQNKRIFAIFGPTNLKMWAPWSNILNSSVELDMPIQSYANITIFQADMKCVACGKAGCNDDHGKSLCLENINPIKIFNEIENWYKKLNYKKEILIQNEINARPRKIVLYIVYGEDQTYYNGAIFSYLTFKNWVKDGDPIEFVVLTEKPEKFANYPIKIIPMSNSQKQDWSINGQYHFRIKNRGMAFAMKKLNMNHLDKILFFDTDTYFNISPLPLFDLIKPKQAVLYLNEGLIFERKRFSPFVDGLEGKEIQIENEFYEISKKSALWGSLLVGVMPNMVSSIDWADKIILKLFDYIDVHTIEEFALAESLVKKYNIVEGKKYVSLYSTSRKKAYATNILDNFFKNNKTLPIENQVFLAQNTKIKRPFLIILAQRFHRIFEDFNFK